MPDMKRRRESIQILLDVGRDIHDNVVRDRPRESGDKVPLTWRELLELSLRLAIVMRPQLDHRHGVHCWSTKSELQLQKLNDTYSSTSSARMGPL